jgi:hypothetical protein
MTVDYDCGHAYNGWTGQLWDLFSEVVEAIGEESYESNWEAFKTFVMRSRMRKIV